MKCIQAAGLELVIIVISYAILSAEGAGAPPSNPARIASAKFGENAVTMMWSPTLEWTLKNNSYQGNPFDVVAKVKFVHESGEATRTTEMFYDGNDTWNFRFTATRPGKWTFTTQADGVDGTTKDPDLHGHSGQITVKPNPAPKPTGFLTRHGNKFALQTGNDAHLEAFRFNAFMHQELAAARNIAKANLFEHLDSDADRRRLRKYIHTYLDAVMEHGCNVLHLSVNCRWFEMGPDKNAADSLEDRSDNASPDPATFERIEMLLAAARQERLRVHLWAWGDQSRRWTPINVGGKNGVPDRRLQRYIAARLGPLPGWSMGYGFDLTEWTSEEDLKAWAEYLHAHMGWPHMLWGRDRHNEELDAISYPGYRVRGYEQIAEDLDSDTSRPHIYEERHTYLRNNQLTQEGTRRFMWHQTLAGGMGGFWGHYDGGYKENGGYPKPEQFVACRTFWEGRFLLSMRRANDLTDGYCLHTPDGEHYIFYKEDTDSIAMDLSSAPKALSAVAVDTKKPYCEIDLGTFNPGKHTWKAFRKSDWAIAVGRFPERRSLSTPPRSERK